MTRNHSNEAVGRRRDHAVEFSGLLSQEPRIGFPVGLSGQVVAFAPINHKNQTSTCNAGLIRSDGALTHEGVISQLAALAAVAVQYALDFSSPSGAKSTKFLCCTIPKSSNAASRNCLCKPPRAGAIVRVCDPKRRSGSNPTIRRVRKAPFKGHRRP
jgi:hypothetical protein